MATIWDMLGITPTRDKRVIKKAYAARVKEIHPEEKPEEFQALYKAYQAALQRVKNAEKRENVRARGHAFGRAVFQTLGDDGGGVDAEGQRGLYRIFV